MKYYIYIYISYLFLNEITNYENIKKQEHKWLFSWNVNNQCYIISINDIIYLLFVSKNII